MSRYLSPVLCLLIALGAATVQAQPPRGALSPAAPVRLDYELPEVLPDAGAMTLPLQLSTPVTSGNLVFEVVRGEGVSVSSGAVATFALTPTQAFSHVLQLMLQAGGERYLIVQLSVDGPQGMLSRSYRIDLSPPPAAGAAVEPVLKLMPAR